MRVVKLGGSLADWDRLPHCLACLVPLGLVIVPGGGPFADQVRAAHSRWRFDQTTAHGMALLAMCQFGRMLAGLEGRLRLAGTLADLRAQTQRGLTAVWLPGPDDPELSGVEASWDVTSDSLAAWAATKLEASELILLKSVRRSPKDATLARLGEDGVVDRAFARHAAAAPFSTWLCHREDYPALAVPGHSPAPDLVQVQG